MSTKTGAQTHCTLVLKTAVSPEGPEERQGTGYTLSVYPDADWALIPGDHPNAARNKRAFRSTGVQRLVKPISHVLLYFRIFSLSWTELFPLGQFLGVERLDGRCGASSLRHVIFRLAETRGLKSEALGAAPGACFSPRPWRGCPAGASGRPGPALTPRWPSGPRDARAPAAPPPPPPPASRPSQLPRWRLDSAWGRGPEPASSPGRCSAPLPYLEGPEVGSQNREDGRGRKNVGQREARRPGRASLGDRCVCV